jgi:hypothetical protein
MYIFVLTCLFLLVAGREQHNYERIYNKCVVLINQIKEKLEPYAINIGYNLLYGFSVCQIEFNKCYRHIKNFVSPYVKEFKNKNKNNMDKMLKKVNKNGEYTTCNEYDEQTNTDTCLYVLYDKTSEENDYINKVIFTEFPKTLDYKESKINFMMIELEHENEKHSIVLKNKEHNYYIVNNSLNQNFFKYYLQNVLKVPINKDKFDYTVTIIDHNVNMITILPHQHLVFNEYDYTIYTIDNNEIITILPKTPTTIEEQSSNSDTDKSDDFVKLEVET